jgi:L-arginine dehydrogenase
MLTEFPNGEGDCIFYPGLLWDLDLIGVKVSPYITGRSKRGLPPVTAFTLLLSAQSGEPVLLVDSLALTTARTAATTALALDYLAPPEAKHLAVIGAGKVAREHLRYVTADRKWASIKVFSPALAAREDPKHEDRTSALAALGFDLTISESPSEAVDRADVILLCTSSGTPVLDLADVRPGATITSISTNVARAHEIDPATLATLDVYCDYRNTAPITAGEMVLASEAGTWNSESIIADLPELVTSSESTLGERTRFFRSTGLGIEDLAIASILR